MGGYNENLVAVACKPFQVALPGKMCHHSKLDLRVIRSDEHVAFFCDERVTYIDLHLAQNNEHVGEFSIYSSYKFYRLLIISCHLSYFMLTLSMHLPYSGTERWSEIRPQTQFALSRSDRCWTQTGTAILWPISVPNRLGKMWALVYGTLGQQDKWYQQLVHLCMMVVWSKPSPTTQSIAVTSGNPLSSLSSKANTRIKVRESSQQIPYDSF